MSTSVSARAKSTAAARSIDRRTARRDRPKPTASPSSRRPSISGPNGARMIAGSFASCIGTAPLPSAAGGGLGQDPPSPLAADLADVLLVLEDDAEGFVDELRTQFASAQREKRARPVERLGNPRHLGQVRLAETVDE